MVSSNKVLTVSYGTFSCTLEGFDDSFDTMKAIAEYFRDLAADDRYFGAEPPQPDAEMLARIAEREIARQVEARADGTGIVLRAADAAPAAAEPLLDSVAATPVVAEPVADVALEAASDPEPVEHVEPVAVAEAAEDDVSTADAEAEIAEIEPVVELSEESPELDDTDVAEFSEDAEVTEDVAAQDVSDDEAPVEAVLEDAAEVIETEVAEVIEPAAEEIPVEDPAPAPVQTSVNSIAEKLARIRAVVARNDADAMDDPTEADQAGESFVESQAAAISDDLTDQDDSLDEDDGQAIEAVLGRLDRTPDTSDDAEQNDEGLFDDLESPVSADLEDDQSDADDADDTTNNILSEADTPDETNTRKIRRVRVRKVKKAELEQAIASGAIEEIAEPDAPYAEPESSLTPEDEADLMRELAEVEAELAPVEAEPISETAPSTEDETRQDQDITRLMAAAQEKLGDPETASKAEDFQNLRAAVAAAEAERSTGGDEEDTKGDPYRADLAEVVKPRRPAVSSAQSSRPRIAAKAAPLKLVAAQRVDDPTPAKAAEPVRPRRIATPVEMPEADDSAEAFTAYVEEMEADGLSELLEAAASYMCFVEGREQFSRPQLMNKVRLVHEGELNREDGLRAFGQLLREGKIQKAGGGRFVASSEIGFQPSARAAG